MSKLVRAFLCIAVLLLGCCSSAAARESITILGFANRVQLTDDNGKILHSFRSAEDALMDELYNGDKLDIYDKTPAVERARVDEIALALDMGTDASILQNVESDYVVYGYLTNMSIKEAVTGITNFVAEVGGDSQCVCVNLSAKVVDVKTGKVVFTATGEGESTRTNAKVFYGGYGLHFGKNNVSEQSANNAVMKAAKEIGKKINEAV